MRVVGRISARGPKLAGLFIPVGSTALEGIYEVVEIMGELQVRRLGDAAMPTERLKAVSVETMLSEKPSSIMTESEVEIYDATC